MGIEKGWPEMQDDSILDPEVFNALKDAMFPGEVPNPIALWILRKWEVHHRDKSLSLVEIIVMLATTQPAPPALHDLSGSLLDVVLHHLQRAKCIEQIGGRFRLTELGARVGHTAHPAYSAHS